MRLDNPLLVRWEYASEERLAKRNAVLRSLSQGPSPEDVAFDAVAAAKPRRIAAIGCGLGELGGRFQQELGAHVCAVDSSERMVDLAKTRGLDAQLAEADALSFPDRDFDSVFAVHGCDHVPPLHKAISAIRRPMPREGT